MPESHIFLCQVCGATLDYPASFEGQTKVCDGPKGCGLNTILKNTAPPQGTGGSPVPIILPPAEQLPSPATEGHSPKTTSPGVANPEATPPENISLVPEAGTTGKPSKVKAIFVFHCVGGPFNILLGLFYLIFGIFLLVGTGKTTFFLFKFGGIPSIIMGVLVMAIGAFEAFSAFKHFGENARPKLNFIKLVAILEIVSILGMVTCMSVIFGILSLFFLTDPRVKEYYD